MSRDKRSEEGPPSGTSTPDGAWHWSNGQWLRVDDSGPHEAAGGSPPPSRDSRGWKTRLGWALGLASVGILLVAAATSSGGTVAGTGSDEYATVRGSLLIVGGGGYTRYDPCHGIAGGGDSYGLVEPFDYSDLDAGTSVRVHDASGDIIGTGALSEGDYAKSNGINSGDGCRFTFDVPLTSTSTHYQLVIADRPPFDFRETDGLDLVVGPH